MGWFKHGVAHGIGMAAKGIGTMAGAKGSRLDGIDGKVESYIAGLGSKEVAKHQGYLQAKAGNRTASQSLATPEGDNAQPKSLGEPASVYRGGFSDSDGGDGLGSTPSGKRKRASQMLGG